MLKDVFCLVKETGKLAVLGSCHMFSDQYIDKEENSKIMVSAVHIYCGIQAEIFVHSSASCLCFLGRCAPVAHDWQHSAESDWRRRPRGERVYLTGEWRRCCLLNQLTSIMSLSPTDHRLQHVARHRVLVRPAQSVFTRGWWKPPRLHVSVRYVFVQFVNRHFAPSHWVSMQNKPECLTSLHFFLANNFNVCFFGSAYKQLNVKDEPLQLITPQFETPLPQLQLAVSLSPALLFQNSFYRVIYTTETLKS